MNTRLNELLNINPNEANQKDNDALIEELKTSKLIMPVEIESDNDEIDESFRFRPVKIMDENKKTFIPLYSDDSEVHGHTSAIDIYTKDLANMIEDNPENINGVVINPFSKFNVELPMESFLKIFK